MSLFGTDGIRGLPGKEPLTADSVRAVAFLAARELLKTKGLSFNGHGPFILMGRDTRASGPALARALAAGFSDAGCRTVDLGVIPTPGVSVLAPRLKAAGGVVISASHNPAEFNGIKFFEACGRKMSPRREAAIEKALRRGRPPRAKTPLRVENGSQHAELYQDFLRSSFPATLDLSGVRLVVDCANGAAYKIAPRLFRMLGAEVVEIFCAPNGSNINKHCGAVHPETLCREARKRRAHAGVCFDGDADRALLCDEKGVLLDGDALIAVSAERLLKQGRLKAGTVVVTVMSNFGLVSALKDKGLKVVSVPVGDKHVTDAMDKGGLSLGGENSGHVVFSEYEPTGDGILTALQTLAAWREAGKPLSAVRKVFTPVPQHLRNLRVARRAPLEGLSRFKAAAASCELRFKGRGRVFVRYSGTEPLLRILVEGPGPVKSLAEELAQVYLSETRQKEIVK